MDLRERIAATGFATEKDLARAVARCEETGEDLATVCWRTAVVDERSLVRCLSQSTGFPGIELGHCVIPTVNVGILPEEVVRDHLVLPIVVTHGEMVAAMAQPTDRTLLRELEFLLGLTILPHVAVPGALEVAIKKCLLLREAGEKLWRGPEAVNLAVSDQGHAAVVHPAEPSGSEDPSATGVIGTIELSEPSEDDTFEVVGIGHELFQGEHQKSAPAKRPPAPAPPTKKIVLVVDDDDDMRALAVQIVRPFDCVILEADNGKDALAMAQEHAPDLMILDAMLPGLHGFEVCRAVKGDPMLPLTAIIMVSGIHVGWKIEVDVRETYGADDFFEKPFRTDELARAIRTHLFADVEARDAEKRRAAALAICDQASQAWSEGNQEEALRLYRSAVGKDPFNAEAHYFLGQGLRQGGRHYEAIVPLERAVALRPDHDKPLVALGQLYQHLGFQQTAIEIFTRLLNANDEDTRTKAALVLDSLRS